MKLPNCIQVDTNMHPDIYKHLLHFAVLFDKTSLYAVSGKYLRLHSPVSLNYFIELIRDPVESPFLLTVPSDWYEKSKREERLNQAVVGWDEYDNRIIEDVGFRDVVQVPISPQIRASAWETIFRYHDFLKSEKIDERDYDGPFTSVNTAYFRANKEFEQDKKIQEQSVNQATNPARTWRNENLNAVFLVPHGLP